LWVAGFVYAAEIISEDTKPEPLLKGRYSLAITKIQLRYFYFGISICCIAHYFFLIFVGEFTVLYSLVQINIWFAILGGTTINLGAYYMLKMFQHAMLGELKWENFCKCNFNEGVTMVAIISFVFGM
jgi:NADH-quinone oxidoreductase subunit M